MQQLSLFDQLGDANPEADLGCERAVPGSDIVVMPHCAQYRHLSESEVSLYIACLCDDLAESVCGMC